MTDQIAQIPVHATGEYPGGWATVDIDVLSSLEGHKWWDHRSGPMRFMQLGRKRQRAFTLARELVECDDTQSVIHLDGDRFNCRRANLRAVQRGIVEARKGKVRPSCSSVYKGVSFVKRLGRWRAYAAHNGRMIDAGTHDTELAAAAARDALALSIWGEMAYLNLPR